MSVQERISRISSADLRSLPAEVASLLQNAERAVVLGEQYAHEGATSLRRCCETGARLEAAHARLELVCAQLRKQLSVLEQLVRKLEARDHRLLEALRQLRARNHETMGALEAIFARLRAQAIDQALWRATGGTERTLYDFVDTDSVDELRKQGIAEVASLHTLQAEALQLVAQINARYEQMRQQSTVILVPLDYRLVYATEKTSRQVNELKSIESLLHTSLYTHHDRVHHYVQRTLATDTAGSDDQTAAATAAPRAGVSSDGRASLSVTSFPTSERALQSLRHADAQLSQSLGTAYDALQRIVTLTHDVDQRMLKYSSAQKNAVAFFQDLEACGSDIKQKLNRLDELEVLFDQRRADARFVFDELLNLVTWYDLFCTAHQEMIFEILRRHKELARQQQLVDSFAAELEAMHRDEAQKRSHFYEFYGRYLPASLCPAIMEPAPHYQIVPRTLITNLPRLQQTHDERPSRSMIDSQLRAAASSTTHISDNRT
mmetsp:Transcript_52360/g.131540  ORF Transcript_52360/g.131540 Transcript_52360/m.131540 type:complete len:491 (-) Transcript_52360:66-1538(-)